MTSDLRVYRSGCGSGGRRKWLWSPPRTTGSRSGGSSDRTCDDNLAQAFSKRAPKGRKHDFRDAERLRRRFGTGALSFVPDPEQRAGRTMTRMKIAWRGTRVQLYSQVEDLLEEMRIKLSCV